MVKDEVRDEVTIVINPPFPLLSSIYNLVKDNPKVFLGAQNCSQHVSGAYTGEVSAPILKSTGCDYVIIGHSERREYFNESNEMLTQKVNRAFENDLTPIFCCGEPLSIREQGKHFDYVCSQLTESLFHYSPDQFMKLVIAYEPIWAIGTGVTATSAQAQDMHARIREHLASKYGKSLAAEITILYGGSCNPKNARELFANPDVDGGLIGGASLKSRDFIDIIKSY
jgi:triosephosphate isomerase